MEEFLSKGQYDSFTEFYLHMTNSRTKTRKNVLIATLQILKGNFE
jgi:hypothetical protein